MILYFIDNSGKHEGDARRFIVHLETPIQAIKAYAERKRLFFYSSLLQQHISQWAPLVGNNGLNEIKTIVTRLYTGKKKSRDARLHGPSM